VTHALKYFHLPNWHYAAASFGQISRQRLWLIKAECFCTSNCHEEQTPQDLRGCRKIVDRLKQLLADSYPVKKTVGYSNKLALLSARVAIHKSWQ
jgi:hypothetical protein